MTTAPQKKPLGFLPAYRGWWIVGVSFTALFTHGAANSYLFGVQVIPMSEDLGWARATLVGALTAATLVAAFTGMLIGPWFDRAGPRVGMTIGAAVGGTSLILMGFITEVWHYYLLLGVGVGATRAILENIGPRTAIANWFIRKRAAAFAWFTGGRAVFGFTMVPVFAWIAASFSWRAGWVVLGLAELLILLPAIWLIVRRRPEDHGLLPDGEGAALHPQGRAPDPHAAAQQQEAGATTPAPTGGRLGRGDAAPAEDAWTRGEALRTRTFWLLIAGFVLTGFPATGVIANMVPYFHDSGLSVATASAGFSLFGLGALLGRPVWGYTVTRFGVYRSMIIYGVTYGAVILSFVAAFDAPTLLAAAVPLGIVTGGAQQLQAQAWPDYYGRRHVGAITGISILFMTPTLAAGPLVAALAFDLLGSYTVVLTAYGLGALGAAVLFALARAPRREG